VDTSEPQTLSNKKQAVEDVSDRPVSAMNVSQWESSSGFHPVTGQFSDRLFGSGFVRSNNSVDKNIPSIGSGNINMGRNDFGNQYGNDSSIGLSMSHSIGVPSPSLNFGGIRKVKVNQVRDSDHGMPAADSNIFSIGSVYNKNDDNITSGPTYDNGSGNTIAMGHVFNKGDGNFLLMGHNYGKGDEHILSMGRSFDRGDGNIITMGQSYGKEDDNLISLGTSYSMGHESITSMGPSYGKSGETFTTMAPSYDKVDSNIASTISSFDSGSSSSLPVSQNLSNCHSSSISFGGFHVNPQLNDSTGMINSSDPLMGNQNSAQGVDSQKDLSESSPNPPANSTPKSNAKNETVVKNKEPKTAKKPSTNSFPSNVKSLLSTGIFDGIPVKYCTWSREVNCVSILLVLLSKLL